MPKRLDEIKGWPEKKDTFCSAIDIFVAPNKGWNQFHNEAGKLEVCLDGDKMFEALNNCEGEGFVMKTIKENYDCKVAIVNALKSAEHEIIISR